MVLYPCFFVQIKPPNAWRLLETLWHSRRPHACSMVVPQTESILVENLSNPFWYYPSTGPTKPSPGFFIPKDRRLSSYNTLSSTCFWPHDWLSLDIGKMTNPYNNASYRFNSTTLHLRADDGILLGTSTRHPYTLGTLDLLVCKRRTNLFSLGGYNQTTIHDGGAGSPQAQDAPNGVPGGSQAWSLSMSNASILQTGKGNSIKQWINNMDFHTAVMYPNIAWSTTCLEVTSVTV